MNPAKHKNEWIQDATQLWNQRILVEQYRADVKDDLDDAKLAAKKYPSEFNKTMLTELTEAWTVLTQRIVELSN